MSDADAEQPSRLVSYAVFFGSALLVGLPTFAVLGEALSSVLAPRTPTVWGWQSGSVVAVVVALVLARQAFVEVAAVRLYGSRALLRGSRRATVVRIGLVGAWTLALAVLFGYGLLEASVMFWESGDARVMGLAVLLALATIGAAGYSLHEFYDGVRAGRA